MITEYYKPSEIIYTRPQFLWILRTVAGSLSWPSDGTESEGFGKAKQWADFEMARMIVGECMTRLAKCHQDGLMLEYLILTEECSFTKGDWPSVYSCQRLARYLRMSRDEAMFCVNTALNYCTGRSRRKTQYYDYKSNERLKWR